MSLRDRIYYKAIAFCKNYKLHEMLGRRSAEYDGPLELLEVAKSISHYLPNVACLIDIGAHKGLFTKAFTTCVNTEYVYCIEPNDSMAKSIRNENPSVKIEIFKTALSNEIGKINYYEHEDSSMNSVIESNFEVLKEKFPFDNPDKLNVREMEVTTLDILLKDRLPEITNAFIKIDTQGSEYKILLGGKETLKKTVGCLIEHMFVDAYKIENTFFELLELMKNNGFRFVGVTSIIRRPTFELSSADLLFMKDNEKAE